MKNKLERTNKAKFDYVSRRLGLFGIIIISATLVFGGYSLVKIFTEQEVLTQHLAAAEQEVNSNIVIVNVD